VNVLWKQVRFHNMPSADAEQLINNLLALPLRIVPVSGLLLTGFQTGLKYQLAVYDSIYIALAVQYRYPLISVDQSQMRAALLEGVTLKPITDF
jgi:predicted nucleic acid-binding protein